MTTCSLDRTTVWNVLHTILISQFIKEKISYSIYCAGCCKAVCSIALKIHFISTSALYAHLQCIMLIYHKVALYLNIINTCRFQQELIGVKVPAQQKIHHQWLFSGVTTMWPPCVLLALLVSSIYHHASTLLAHDSSVCINTCFWARVLFTGGSNIENLHPRGLGVNMFLSYHSTSG